MDEPKHSSQPAEESREGDSSSDSPPTSPGDAFASAARHVSEAKEFAANYLSAKADAAKLSLRKLLVALAIGLVAALSAAAIVMVSIALLLVGLAGAIGTMFTPPKPWLGDLIVGAAALIVAVVGAAVMLRKFSAARRAKTVSKYESRHVKQRRQFGRDVATDSVTT